MHSNEIIHRGLSFRTDLLVRPFFSLTFDLKVMSIDTTLHLKFYPHIFQNGLNR